MNQNTNQNNEIGTEIDLVKLFGVIWHRAWLIAICAILGGVIAWFATIQFAVPKYKTDIQMYVYVKQGGANASEIAAAKHLVNTCGIYLKTDDVLERVIEEAGVDISTSTLRSMIEYSAEMETEIFRVTVSGTDGVEIVHLANAITKVLPDAVSKGLNPDINVRGLGLATGSYRYSPNIPQNTLLGVLIGIMLSVGIVVLGYIFDPYIKSEEDISHVYGIPLLTVVPYAEAYSKKSYRRYGGYYGSKNNGKTY